jgi:hypothetical protein
VLIREQPPTDLIVSITPGIHKLAEIAVRLNPN